MGLDEELKAYYNAEAIGGHRVEHGAMRHELRERFRDLLRVETCTSLVDVGAGPGLDTLLWNNDGFDVVGVDLGPQNCRTMEAKGLLAVNASLYDLPFVDAVFDALWTMSTFVHVPPERVGDALRELLRVVKPGGPIAIGTWGGRDFAGYPEFGEIRPFRYFSLQTDDRWLALLEAECSVDSFETISPNGDDAWKYQFAIVRTRPTSCPAADEPPDETSRRARVRRIVDDDRDFLDRLAK